MSARTLAAVAVLLAASGILRAQGDHPCPSFPNPLFEVGFDPLSVMSADLDGDGDADLVTANWAEDTASVLLNQGNGTFAPHVEYWVGDFPSSVTSADMDGDGDADLATANGSYAGTVSVLLNQGDGTFATHVEYGVADNPSSVTSADLDGDGDADLAVANAGSDTVSVLRNRGDGTFATHVQHGVGDGPISVTSADLDGDGDADLAVANVGSDTVSVLRNQGDGTFAPHVEYGVGDYPRSVTTADLDGDGDADLAVANLESDTDSVLLNRGDGTFASHVEYGVGKHPNAVTSADLDGDGDADLATAIDPHTMWVLLNQGDGTFATPLEYGVGAPPSSLTTADLDGDGDADLATANIHFANSGTVSVLLNEGDGTFAPHVDYGVGDYPQSVTSADLDADGDADLAVANGGYTVSVLLNQGDGTFAKHVEYRVGGPPTSVTSADLDGDGDVDLATTYYYWRVLSGTISVLLNLGDGTFAGYVDYGVGHHPSSLTSADLDGDGDADLAAANASFYPYVGSTVSVLLNHGDGTFARHVEYGVGDHPFSVTSADLDGDGDADLATANIHFANSGTVSVLLNEGDGTFAPHVEYGVGIYPSSVTSADLDRDGAADLAVAHTYTPPGYWGTVSVLLNQGDGTFATHVQYGVGRYLSSVTSTDLDRDGDADLAVANSYGPGSGSSPTVSVLLNTCSCSGDASWANYGSGWPGTLGIPTFTAASDPELCSTLTLNLDNSLGANTTTALLIGLAQTDQPTIYDGHLLVAPTIVLLLPLPGGGLALTGTLPCDPILCGVSLYLQALEVDAGASKGLSFTPGLQLVLGS